MKASMVSAKDRLLEHIEKVAEHVDWELPGEATERCAPYLLIKLYKEHKSARAAVKAFLTEKEMEKSHVADQLLILAAILDSQVASNDDFINSRACELICRRIYGYQRAFDAVKTQADWKQPKGSAASKWKSKVRWDLLPEIDLEALDGEDAIIQPMERDLQKRLEKKALMHKYLAKSLEAGGTAEIEMGG
jgi:hypothetical protein